jgi:hypothetical protein
MNVVKPLMLLAEFVVSPHGLRRIFADGSSDSAVLRDGEQEPTFSDMPHPDDWARWPFRLRSDPWFHP